MGHATAALAGRALTALRKHARAGRLIQRAATSAMVVALAMTNTSACVMRAGRSTIAPPGVVQPSAPTMDSATTALVSAAEGGLARIAIGQDVTKTAVDMENVTRPMSCMKALILDKRSCAHVQRGGGEWDAIWWPAPRTATTVASVLMMGLVSALHCGLGKIAAFVSATKTALATGFVWRTQATNVLVEPAGLAKIAACTRVRARVDMLGGVMTANASASLRRSLMGSAR